MAEAYLFGADAHEAQFRSSGEPYMSHPVAVAKILADLKMDPETIIAALLHDVVEDTDFTQEDIQQRFGETVAKLVKGVTKLLKIEFTSQEEAQAENFRKMMLAMVEDVRVIIIKLADRCHNMRTLGALRPDKRRRIAHETLEIYAPIANRLGMHTFRNEFQRLGFEALYPRRYEVLSRYVAKAYQHRERLFNKILSLLKRRLEEEGVVIQAISAREKQLYSIYQKMQSKQLSFSEIMDVYGYRVTVNARSDCYQVLGAVHGLFKPVPGKFKDYIAIPKANGYQSLHTTLFGPHGVPIEIQIRTTEMDTMAENGIAAHWAYKESGYVNMTDITTQAWLKQLLEFQAHAGDSVDFTENVKMDLYKDEVYVFTPRGHIKAFPRGATALDFAYAVHTEVGNHCAYVKVNRRRVPMSYELINGLTIEVVTSQKLMVKPAWMKYVFTGRAKAAIRHSLKERDQAAIVRLGHQLFEAALQMHDIDWAALAPDLKQSLIAAFDLNAEMALFVGIGSGELNATVVVKQLLILLDRDQLQVNAPVRPLALEAAQLLDGQVNFATCCHPIPGDHIVGLLDVDGLTVHLAGCVQIQNVLSRQRIIELQWSHLHDQYFDVGIELQCLNQRGIIGEVATLLSKESVDISGVEIKELEDNYGVMTLSLRVLSRQHLAHIFRLLRRRKNIFQVARV